MKERKTYGSLHTYSVFIYFVVFSIVWLQVVLCMQINEFPFELCTIVEGKARGYV